MIPFNQNYEQCNKVHRLDTVQKIKVGLDWAVLEEKTGLQQIVLPDESQLANIRRNL